VDGVSIAPVMLGKAKTSGREWIMALGHGPAKLDEQGVRGIEDFATRVIRDKRFKVWVTNGKKLDRLHDLAEDPWEETNLVQGDLGEAQQAALRKFQAVVDSLPDRDARPLYEPRAPNAWDQKPAAGKRRQ
jgi:arylsulfatase A-like enzyme